MTGVAWSDLMKVVPTDKSVQDWLLLQGSTQAWGTAF